MKVLIAGAGPTGLVTGVELARRGVLVTVIERRSGGSTLSRAVGINPRSLEILTVSGVTEKLLEQGIKYKFIQFYKGATAWVNLPLTIAPIQHGHNYMLGLPQDQTEEILREALIKFGGEIKFNKELKNVSQNQNEVTIETTSGEKISADYLVGADGIRGATREAVGIERVSTELPGVWSIADAEVDNWPHLNAATICLMRRGKMAAIIPLGGIRLRLISNTENVLSTLPLDIHITKVHREGQFNILLSHVKQYHKDRVYLAGDAAHSQSPAGGRGMNLGIADAADLAKRLVEGGLESYDCDRQAEGKLVMDGAEQIRRTFVSAQIKRGLIYLFLKIVSKVPFLQRKLSSKFLYG